MRTRISHIASSPETIPPSGTPIRGLHPWLMNAAALRLRIWLVLWVLGGLLLSYVPPLAAQDKTLTPERVRTAIKNGVEYLKTHQGKDGSWEHLAAAGRYKGGLTALAMLALLESGVELEDQTMVDGLKYLRNLESEDTYVVALQTMVLSHAKPEEDKVQIKRNVEWLKQTVKREGGRMIGWGYPKNIPGADNSNTQYAVLALREASQAGVGIPDELWVEIQNYYIRTQLENGGWAYRNEGRLNESDRLTMTSAGVCGLLITGMQLYRNRETIDPNTGAIDNCGEFLKNDPLAKGLLRLGDTFTVRIVNPPFKFYNLYGLERAGRLSGQRFFTGRGRETHDWYRAGAEYLLGIQMQPEGCWRGDNIIDGHPVIATSFALLFLAKGKTPVLFHKMLHGLPHNERGLVGDWNNDRNDVRNLTEYCSKEIFKKNGRPVPLTWQAFDASKLDPSDPTAVAELLQAPILYINGHKAPQFTDGEKKLLRDYVEQGGFILAEACCGRKEFDAGFRKLVREIWKDQPEKKLEPLSEGHPVWTAAFAVPPGSFKLEGIDFGCKTCLIYAPEDLSCHWESNHFDGPNGRTQLAFRAGANIAAYATGLEPPEDKLTKVNIVSDKPDLIKRNFLHVAQLNYGGRDWQPAPHAMRNLMDHVQKNFDVDVILQTKALTPGDPNLPDYKFLYMHGRREFTIPEENVKRLREHLEGGGILLADACCGSEKFDKSFRDLMQQMFPDRKLEPIKLDDPLFTDKIGKKITTLQLRTQRGAPHATLPPQLEGIRLDPKNARSPWIVIYSKYDLGCALDRHSTTDCLGYNHESALELAAQVVLYALKE